MAYDWNSFYGTFAQASGALIGIIAAFLISRLLGLADKFSVLRESFDKLTLRYTKLKHALSKRNFKWHNERIIEYSDKLEKAIKERRFKDKTREEILPELYKILYIFKDDNGIYEAFSVRQNQILSRNLAYPSVNIPPTGLWDSIDDERERIGELEVETHALIDEFNDSELNVKDFSRQLRPLAVLIILLLIAFPITVVYPLHFLPIPANSEPKISFALEVFSKFTFSLKGLFLWIFFVLFEGAFFYFLLLIVGILKEIKQLLSEYSEEYFNVNSYSPFLHDKKVD